MPFGQMEFGAGVTRE